MNLFIPLIFSPGLPEILLLGLVVVLLFGGRKIPELMKGLGQGMKEFKKATKEDNKKDDKDHTKEKIDS
jgi:sec-independent protein translocase protein TatA